MNILNKIIPILVGFIIFAGANTGAAQPITLTFDDLPNASYPGGLVPNGYGGLDWQNFGYFNGTTNPIPSGYQHAVVSPNTIIVNPYGMPAAAMDGDFAFNSAYFTAAWNDGLNVHVDGYSFETLLYSRDFSVDTSGPTLVTFDWSGINNVRFSSSGGVPHGFGGSGIHFAIDNFTFTPIPEPSTLALLGMGGIGLIAFTWQRKR